MEETKNKSAALAIMLAVAETIREAHRIPSGHLYAALMTKGLTFDQYNTVVRHLKGAGLVSESANMLTWTGPHLAPMVPK